MINQSGTRLDLHDPISQVVEPVGDVLLSPKNAARSDILEPLTVCPCLGPSGPVWTGPGDKNGDKEWTVDSGVIGQS